MAPEESSSLQLPSFLQGSYSSVQQKTRKEGLRCGEQYRENGTFPPPKRMLEVPPGDLVLTHEVTDFQRELPAWRLYMVSNLMGSLNESGESVKPFPVRHDYEAFFRQTAWGALFFAITHMGTVSPERTAPRIQAVLRFWEPLQAARYLFKTLGQRLTLEELIVASCDWAMDAWCPGSEAPVRSRLALAAERMARATREDSIEAILRQLPRALSYARNLKHRDVVSDPSFQRERLAALDPWIFERASAACTSDLLGLVYSWDRQLGTQ